VEGGAEDGLMGRCDVWVFVGGMHACMYVYLYDSEDVK
jgi:hypothetical protein